MRQVFNLTYLVYSPPAGVRVIGHYDDGVDRDLGGAWAGTSFSSSDDNIATVDEDGVVTPRRVGSATIQVVNGGLSVDVPVSVVGAKGDFNADGVRDLSDLASLVDCISGPIDGDTVTATVQCRDVFDYDRDYDVDVKDFAVFAAEFDIQP